MKISIVTPVLNDRRVARALDSILAQRHEHELESIVIDGGSTDGTRDVLETYRDRVSMLVSEPDRGIYDAMNKGVAMATGEVVGILNADDRYSDAFVIRDVMDAFADPQLDACYGDVMNRRRSGRVMRLQPPGAGRRAAWRSGWMPAHPGFFVRRRIYDRFGAFDLRFAIAADYEFMLRTAFKHRIAVKCLRRVLVDMAPGGNSNRSLATVLKAALEVTRAWQCNGLGYANGCLAAALKLARKPAQFVYPWFPRPTGRQPAGSSTARHPR